MKSVSARSHHRLTERDPKQRTDHGAPALYISMLQIALLANVMFLSGFVAVAANPDPYAIYKTAVHRLALLEQPQFVDDTEHWTIVRTGGGEGSTEEHFQRTIFNSEERKENILSVPFNAHDPLMIGESYFAPDSWLIGKPSKPTMPNNDNGPNMRPNISDLRTIVSVTAVAKPIYDVSLVKIDKLIDGGTAYHLSLRPRSNPYVHNIRELWVNTVTYDINRAVIFGAYRPSYRDILENALVTEDFGLVGRYHMVIHRVWTYSDPYSAVHYQYNATSMAMRFPKAVPSWFFDAREFSKHLGDVDRTLDAL